MYVVSYTRAGEHGLASLTSQLGTVLIAANTRKYINGESSFATLETVTTQRSRSKIMVCTGLLKNNRE